MNLISNLRTSHKLSLVSSSRSIFLAWNDSLFHHYPLIIQKKRYSRKPSFSCKVALVTGGAQGTGFQVAEGLLDNGARAVVFGGSAGDAEKEAAEKLNNKYGEEKVFLHATDLVKTKAVENMFIDLFKKFRRIDFVVNSAEADGDVQKSLDINLNSMVLGTILGFRYMGVHNGWRGGYIINVASILGLQPFFGSPVYAGTKHFAIGFGRSMGCSYFYNLSKVKVFVVCPGITDTLTSVDDDKGFPGFKDLRKDASKELCCLPAQEPGELGKNLVTMLEDGENGSVWVSEGMEFYKANLPSRDTFKPPPSCTPSSDCSPISPKPPRKKSKKSRIKVDPPSKSSASCKISVSKEKLPTKVEKKRVRKDQYRLCPLSDSSDCVQKPPAKEVKPQNETDLSSKPGPPSKTSLHKISAKVAKQPDQTGQSSKSSSPAKMASVGNQKPPAKVAKQQDQTDPCDIPCFPGQKSPTKEGKQQNGTDLSSKPSNPSKTSINKVSAKVAKQPDQTDLCNKPSTPAKMTRAGNQKPSARLDKQQDQTDPCDIPCFSGQKSPAKEGKQQYGTDLSSKPSNSSKTSINKVSAKVAKQPDQTDLCNKPCAPAKMTRVGNQKPSARLDKEQDQTDPCSIPCFPGQKSPAKEATLQKGTDLSSKRGHHSKTSVNKVPATVVKQPDQTGQSSKPSPPAKIARVGNQKPPAKVAKQQDQTDPCDIPCSPGQKSPAKEGKQQNGTDLSSKPSNPSKTSVNEVSAKVAKQPDQTDLCNKPCAPAKLTSVGNQKPPARLAKEQDQTDPCSITCFLDQMSVGNQKPPIKDTKQQDQADLCIKPSPTAKVSDGSQKPPAKLANQQDQADLSSKPNPPAKRSLKEAIQQDHKEICGKTKTLKIVEQLEDDITLKMILVFPQDSFKTSPVSKEKKICENEETTSVKLTEDKPDQILELSSKVKHEIIVEPANRNNRMKLRLILPRTCSQKADPCKEDDLTKKDARSKSETASRKESPHATAKRASSADPCNTVLIKKQAPRVIPANSINQLPLPRMNILDPSEIASQIMKLIVRKLDDSNECKNTCSQSKGTNKIEDTIIKPVSKKIPISKVDFTKKIGSRRKGPLALLDSFKKAASSPPAKPGPYTLNMSCAEEGSVKKRYSFPKPDGFKDVPTATSHKMPYTPKTTPCGKEPFPKNLYAKMISLTKYPLCFPWETAKPSCKKGGKKDKGTKPDSSAKQSKPGKMPTYKTKS